MTNQPHTHPAATVTVEIPPSGLLTVKAAATWAGCSPSTIRRAGKDGVLETVWLTADSERVHIDALLEWVRRDVREAA